MQQKQNINHLHSFSDDFQTFYPCMLIREFPSGRIPTDGKMKTKLVKRGEQSCSAVSFEIRGTNQER